MENKSFYKKKLFLKKCLTEKRTEGHNSITSFLKSLADQCKYIRLTKIIIIYPNSKVKIKEK